jgi:hypothetical protein
MGGFNRGKCMLDINHGWIVLERVGEIVLNNVKGCVIELGGGVSTPIMMELAKKFDRNFYTCDSRGSICDWIRGNVKYEKINVMHQNSWHFILNLKDTPAVVFHDCDHRWRIVRKEVDKLIEILAPGGVIFIHDTAPPVWRYEQKIAKGKKMNTFWIRKFLEERKDVDTFTWRYTAADCGLTMILKKDMTEPEYRT